MEMAADLTTRTLRLKPSVKLACVCLTYAATTALLFPASFLAAFGETRMRIYYLLIPPMMLLGLSIAGIINRPQSPLGFVRDKIVSRGVGASLTILIFMACLAAFTASKHDFSGLVSFFADPLLSRIDAAIHFGDPWRWARSIPLPAFFDRLIYILYSQLWIVQLAGVVIFAAWIEDAAARERYFTALMASVLVLGVGVRLIASSAGPIFYDRMFGGDRFADLIATLRTSNAGPETLQITDYLYASYISNKTVVGSGITAMPSFHVAIVTLNSLFLTSINRWVGAVAWLYAALILFGSVYSGWHYAVDGYVSIAAMFLLWRWSQTKETATSPSNPAVDVACTV